METKIKKRRLQRLISGLLIPTILGVQIFSAPVTFAQNGLFGPDPNEPTQVTSLIAVLVEDDLLEDNTDYIGLRNDYPDDLLDITLRDRINRFARDVQLTQPFTRSLILRVNDTDTPVQISNSLETLYFKGDGRDDIKSELNGVIVIGDIPLPVVNKNGYRFMSLFPYTDFEKKAYFYNARTNEFERNNDVLLPKVEAWHGVIKTPASESNELYANYFDKNHLFHIGNPDFTEFDQTMLYADTYWEQQMMDGSTFPRYENYANNLEDISYKRFTKNFLSKLIKTRQMDEGDGIDDDFDGFIDEDLEDGEDNDNDGLIDEDAGENPENIDMETFDDLPDIQSRNVILSYAMRYSDILTNYIQKANDFVDGIGRYEKYDSTVSLITAKDLYTQEFLRYVNNAVEKRIDEIALQLQEPVQLLEESQLTGQITFDDNTTASMQSVEFVTQPKYPYLDPNLGLYEIIYFYGKPAPELENPQECTLFRGINVEHNRLYNPETREEDPTGYAGCFAGNFYIEEDGTEFKHPERCIPELATKWVFDELGTWTHEDIPQSALGIGGCYDFKEKTRFEEFLTESLNYLTALDFATTEEEKTALIPPGSKYREANEILLYQSGSLSITYKDILDIYGGFDGEDNDKDGEIDEQDEYSLSYKLDENDPYKIGLELLGNKKTHFIISDPPFQGIKQIDLYIIQTPTVTNLSIPSITFHKEPTVETIQEQLDAGFPNSLPTDDPRFVEFQDQNGVFQTIDYPNVFDAESIEDFTIQLEELEQYLIGLPGSNPTSIDGSLTELLDGEDNIYEDPSKQILLQTSDEIVGDSIEWKDLSIDQKYAYIVRTYIDRDKDAYVGEKENGYEYMYFTAEGSADEIEFNINSDPIVPDRDEEFLDPESGLAEEAIEEEEDGEEEEALLLPAWIPYIIGYLAELPQLVLSSGSGPSCSEDDNNITDFLTGEDSDADGIPDDEDLNPESADGDGDGVPDGAEATVSLQISFENENEIISTNSTETYKVYVSALDSGGQKVTSDSYTEVKLEIVQSELNPQAEIYGEDAYRLLNGETSFTITPTDTPGEFTLIARTLNRPTTIISNNLPLYSEERRVRITTYETELVEAPSFTQEILKDFILSDQDGNEIAQINANTGKIDIKNTNYDIEVFEATPEKPVRIGIIEISTENIVGSLVIVPNETEVPVIQETTFSFEENALQLDGVHLKDLNRNDNYIAYIDSGSAYILDNSGTYSRRTARVTSDGKVFLADEYFIDIKNADSYEEPYIFIIEDSNGTELFEFFIAYPLGEMELHEEANQLEGFNNVASLIKFLANNLFKKVYAQSKLTDDTDGDGLKDIEEIFIGTQRLLTDTDGDGFEDGEEINSGYDPLRKDEVLFADLNTANPAYNAIIKLLLRGILTRTADNRIRPDDKITREEYVQMVLGITCTNCASFSEQTKQGVQEKYNQSPFPDTDISDEFLYCVEEAKNEGIVSGYAAGTDFGFFKPKYNISRAEAVKVILEAADLDSSEYIESGKPWYYQYILKAQELQIFARQSDPSLYPVSFSTPEDFKTWIDNQLSVQGSVFETWILSSISRAEFALMVTNVIEEFDCYTQDEDNDGLPDNFERYQYNTDVQSQDTDGGGLDDLSEIIEGKDPLNPDDDLINDKDSDGMTDDWEQQNNLDPLDPSDAFFDSDIDGLINLDEFNEETNPRNPDTDGGGVQDGDEVWLQSTDPLEGSDDINGVLFNTGLNAIGNTIERDIVYEIVEGGKPEEVPVYTDNMPADGESTLFLSAEILDANGDILTDDNTSIIEFSLDPESTTEANILQPKVRVSEGNALTQIASTTKAGLVEIDAIIVGNPLPTELHEVFIEPLEPVSIEIKPESPVIRTGGLSKTPLIITLLDENDNIVNNDFFEITVTVEGPGTLDATVDIKPEEEGIQLQSFEGIFTADLFSTDDQGEITITASLNKEYEDFESEDFAVQTITIESQATVNSTENISLNITQDKTFLLANGEDVITLRVQAVDFKGDPILGFNQPIVFKSANDTFGQFTQNPNQSLIDGDSQISFISSTVSGQAEITATVPGIDPATVVIPVLATDPYEMRIQTVHEKFDASSDKSSEVEARVYDRYGNFIDYEDTVPITFRITEATEKYAEIVGDDTVTTEKGIAKVTIKGKDLSGPVNLVASSDGLISGTKTLTGIAKIDANDLVGTYPDVLYASMLGAPFGDTTSENYIAGKLLFAGKTQAVTALTNKSKPKKPLLHVTNNGGLDNLDESQLMLDFIPSNANFSPNRVIALQPDTQENIAELFFMFGEEIRINIRDSLFSDVLQEGIFIIKKTDDELYDFKRKDKKVSITYEGVEAVSITDTGRIIRTDNLFDISLGENTSPFLTLVISRGEDVVADVVFAINIFNDVQIVSSDFEYQVGFPYQPGIYIRPFKPLSNYRIEPSFTGTSTNMPKGAYITNTDLLIPQDQSPGFSYSSLNKVYDEQGIGFDGDNKHVLFFSAGNSVGVSNNQYASDIGINLGDPTISINNEALASSSGFTQDIGRPLYFGEESVHEIVLSDYNNDTLDDILLAYENGEVRLLQNQLSAEQFKDKGLLLDVASGINSIDSADFNNDGYDDLLIATKESCIGDEVCIYIYTNQEGQFVRQHLELEIEDKLSDIKIADVNNDDFPDIIVAEFSGNIKVFYNDFGEFDTSGQLLENLGLRVDSGLDLKEEVLIHYSGMPEEDENSLEDDFNFKKIQLETGPVSQNEFLSIDEAATLEELGASPESFATPEDFTFIYVDKDPIFGNPNSKKQAIDINGETLKLDDKIVYTITLFNQNSTDIENLMVSDIIPDTLELDVDSIRCLNCQEEINLIETGQSIRSHVFANIDIPAGEKRDITYETKIISIPEISIDVNSNFDAPFPKDEYIDISANPEGNTSGKLLFFYSVSKNPQTGRMTYAKYTAEAEGGDPVEQPYSDIDLNNNDVPDEIEDMYESMNSDDDDGDGIPNSWDDANGEIDSILDDVIAGLEEYSCTSGGCLPIPFNKAFLAPGNDNNFGVPGTFDPGTPVFVYGPVKVFLSPTLTGMLGQSVCVGGQCMSVAIPLIPPDVCDAITDAVTSAMSKVGNFVSSASSSTMLLSGNGSNSNTSSLSPRSETGGLTGSSVLGNYQVNASVNTNVKIPGFINIIAGWFAKQYEEILNKLSDLPDLYVLYPDPNSFVNDMPPKAEFKNFNDVLTYVNKLPLIDLESRSVVLKIPALSQKEIDKLQSELNRWVVNAKAEIKRFSQSLQLIVETAQIEIPDVYSKLLVDAEKTIESIEKNIKILEEYKKLPRKILEWRNMQIKYINQIICYLDTIVQYMGGYFKKQQTRINKWIDLIAQIKATLESWSIVNEIMFDYQSNCSSCKTERFTLMEILAKIFVVLPELPVIPLPKLPDFYFDFSQVQLGLKVIWPDIKFKAEPIIFPKIPQLRLPDLPDISVEIPKLPELPEIVLTLPEIPVLPEPPALPELPDLPPLPLPALPDIPKPPKIPNISGGIKVALGALSKVVKIICLLKKSLLPVAETQLKTHIETLTARPLKAVFPIDTIFTLQSPSITFPFVEKIKVTSKVDLRIETKGIYDAANEVAKEWNSIITDIFEAAGEIEIPEVPEIPGVPELPETVEVSEELITQYSDAYNLINTIANEFTEYNKTIPESYYLAAEQSFIQNDNTIINKDIDEIKKRINAEKLPQVVENSYSAQLRSALIAYIEEEEKIGNLLYENPNFDQLIYIAQNYPTLEKYLEKRLTASIKPLFSQGREGNIEKFNEIEELAQNIKHEFDNRLLALDTDKVSSNVIDADEAANPSSGEQLEGLFLYNAEEGVNEKILVYRGELNLEHNALIVDIDEDTDEDIIYSYGGNVYLKENYKFPKASKYLTYLASTPDVYNISEFTPFSPSVNNYSTTYDSGTSADFNWMSDASGTIAGYEIVYKDNRHDFDSERDTPSTIVNIFEEPQGFTTIGRIKEDIEITVIGGSFTVNGETSNIYTFGDSIETSEESDTRVIITFSDSSQIVLGPDSDITIPDYIPGNFEITVNKGNVEFISNFFTNLFLQEGSTVFNNQGDIQLVYKNGDTVTLQENTVFFGSNVQEGYAYIEELNGSGKVNALPRSTATSGSAIINVTSGELIHTMEDSVIVLTPPEENRQILTLSANTIFPISQNYTGEISLDISSGKAEIITLSNERDPEIALEQGMLLQFDDELELENGTAVIRYSNGARTFISGGDKLILSELTNPENPYFTLDTNEGNYYSQVYTYDRNGARSNPSEIELFAPQLCSDNDVPFAEAGPSEKEIIIFQELVLDASQSFDPSGEIAEYYIDTNPEEDTDNDGNPENDKDIINENINNPIFNLGPFEETGTLDYVLNVKDESGNIGKQLIKITIIIPDITLNESSDHEDEVTGSIDPEAENIPITLVRNRDGVFKDLAQQSTNEDGEFVFSGLKYEDTILLRNSDGDIIAEIDNITGRILIVDERYYVDVLEALPPNMPTRIVIKEKATENILLTMLLIPDLNTDVTIDSQDINYTTETVLEFEGVHIKDRNNTDSFEINALPASDPNFTGAAEIRDTLTDVRISIIDSGGNIYFFDENLDLRLKATGNLENPLLIEMLYGNEVIAEIYIAINNGRPVEIVSREAIGLPPEITTFSDQDNDGMSDSFEFMHGFDAQNPGDANEDTDGDGLSNLEEFRLGTNPLNSDSDGDGFSDSEEVAFGKDPNQKASAPFADVNPDHPYYENIVNLSQKNILRGVIRDDELYFNPDAFIARKDFADIILKMLCIIPRQEAYLEPALFSDVPYSEDDYYYPVIKEAVLQGFITGYVGEIDAETGLSPFKPNISISRAEAIKIVLEALEKQKIITLKDIQVAEDEVWYAPYIRLSQDMTPNLLEESAVKETFILTPEEAQNPNKPVTRAEFVAIADRVLQAFDCFRIDDDEDGIPSVWELQYDLDPFDPSDAELDPDNEGLINLDEYRFGTNPFDPDTDDGGTNDKDEVDHGTNPVNFPEDDPFDDDNDGLTTQDEINIYNTDPFDPDTDDGSVYDGLEVSQGTDPLDPSDDLLGALKDPRSGLEEGVYIVEDVCNSCPCESAIDHRADLIPGDIFFGVIANDDMSTIFSKSNELIFKGF